MSSKSPGAYRLAGVDIDAQAAALSGVKELVRSTFNPQVLSEIGSFGGLFKPDLDGVREPVLVASADGVGTKLAVAGMARDYSTVGGDLVNHCVNDILVQGARPLFFLDYIGAGLLDPKVVVELVEGLVAACRANGCALLGGETAEMPGFYQPNDYELVGFIVGMADRGSLFDGSRVRPGDRLLGLPSAGLHTNGYSLARKVFFEIMGLQLDDPVPGLEKGQTVKNVLLAPHLSYLRALEPLLNHPGLHAMAHITGGGLTDNVPRVLAPETRAMIDLDRWDVPAVFETIEENGDVERAEMLRVFNMGIGMVLVVDECSANEVQEALQPSGERVFQIGAVESGKPGVEYLGSGSPR